MFLILAITILGGGVLYYFDPIQYWFMPKCPFKLITGLSCPGCGIQRAAHAILHGDFSEGIKYNYYLVYSGPYATAFVLEWIMPKSTAREKLSNVIENRYVVNFYLLSFTVWMVVRNVLNI